MEHPIGEALRLQKIAAGDDVILIFRSSALVPTENGLAMNPMYGELKAVVSNEHFAVLCIDAGSAEGKGICWVIPVDALDRIGKASDIVRTRGLVTQ